jgi:hypothetical protein
VPLPGGAESGELYVGLAAKSVTAGFRIYSGSKYKQSALACIAAPRVVEDRAWLGKQKRRLSKRCESYWYSVEKGEWTKRDGWPASSDWPRVRGWIVRCKLTTAAASRPAFARDLAKVFRDVYPLLRFTCLADGMSCRTRVGEELE